MTNIALEHFRTMSEHVPNAGREHYSDNRRPAGIQYHTAIILLIISLLACYIPNISPDIADVGCEVLTHVSPVFAKLVCADIKYNIPNIGKIFHYGASVFEQVNITGASAENRARLAVEISEGYRAMTDLKTLVKQSDIPNRVELTGALQSYATNARNTAELIMETDFQTKTTLDKFIRLTRYLASVLEDAQGKNMGRAVRILWSEFTNGIEKNVKALNAVINLAAESKTRLRNLGEELIEIHELIIEAKKIADILVAPEKEIHVLSGLWIRIGQSEKDYSQDLELLGKLERQRELDADRVEKTSQLLHKYLRYLEGMREPANDIVLSKNSKNADGYVQLINSMNGALERMANVKKSIEAEPVVLAK